MRWTNDPGRSAGLVYLLAMIPGFFGLIYVPQRLIVGGDAARTAHNIAASEMLFRLGVAADLAGQALFVVVALKLYHLLREVHPRRALAMLTLILIAIPIALLSEGNAIAALLLVQGSGDLSGIEEPLRSSLAMLFLGLRRLGFAVAGIFWGLWLFPLGLLVYRSRFLPRALGLLLFPAGVAYLVNSLTFLVLPDERALVSRWMDPLQLAEVLFMLWLVVRGTRPPAAPETIPYTTPDPIPDHSPDSGPDSHGPEADPERAAGHPVF